MKKLRHQNFLFAIAWLSGLALFVNGPGAEASEWIEPIKGEITDQFGTRGGKHKGLDIGAPEGEAVAAYRRRNDKQIVSIRLLRPSDIY
nr:hypothetical protein [Bacillus licheniformis]